MEIIDRFSKTLGLSNQGEEQDTDPSKQEESPPPQPEQDEPSIQPPPPNLAGHNVIDFNSAARESLMNNNTNNNTAKPLAKSKITTVRPKNFDDDAKVIADCLRDDIPVIINLEDTSPEHARRIVDFSLGTTYAIGGEIQQVSEYVFVCTPKTVTVTFNREEQKPERDFSWLTRKI